MFLNAVFCCDIVPYGEAPISHAHVFVTVISGVMMDVDWNTQRLCECKALSMFVSVCLLFKLYASLPNVTCYSNCICVWKCICKEKHKDLTQ